MLGIKMLEGKVITNITISENKEEINFICETGEKYKMFHYQDCCESVCLEDVCGNLSDLLGVPIVMAEEVSEIDENAFESGTWTFYKLATCKGYVTLRWYGYSNGYYSEEVYFTEID